ncbi:hypothetical protein KUCAC02_007118, partial [Chaenocephalus aceratus]
DVSVQTSVGTAQSDREAGWRGEKQLWQQQQHTRCLRLRLHFHVAHSEIFILFGAGGGDGCGEESAVEGV